MDQCCFHHIYGNNTDPVVGFSRTFFLEFCDFTHLCISIIIRYNVNFHEFWKLIMTSSVRYLYLTSDLLMLTCQKSENYDKFFNAHNSARNSSHSLKIVI